jgi:arylformamidase
MNRKYYEVSLPLSSDIAVYPGDPRIEIKEACSIAQGSVCNVSLLTFGSHTGTHIDAPKHFYDEGLTVDQLPLEHFLGRAKVFEIKDTMEITVEDLKPLPMLRGDRILLKTRNSALMTKGEFDTDFTHITPEAARYLAEIGIRTLGFDYLSVEKYGVEVPETHYALLGAGIVIIEGLVMGEVPPGEYEMIALPLNIKGGNGSPIRVVLVEDE